LEPGHSNGEPLQFQDFRKSFYYGTHADMQFKFLARMPDDEAAAVVADILHRLGEAFDTADLSPVREVVYDAQARAYAADSSPVVADAPFTPVTTELSELRLALVSAGGVFRAAEDPMGPDGPSQEQSLGLIKEFLRGSPTLSVIPRDTADHELTARHPGYDARTAQRDPGTVFPLAVLRELEAEGRVRLADRHYAFVGATSQRRLRDEVAPRWVEQLQAQEVDVCLLVAT
jgi:D-proline reductase (dithiol) PrdB